MKTRKLIKEIQRDYDAIHKSGIEFYCCRQTLENLVEHLGGSVIGETITIPIPSDEFREKEEPEEN